MSTIPPSGFSKCSGGRIRTFINSSKDYCFAWLSYTPKLNRKENIRKGFKGERERELNEKKKDEIISGVGSSKIVGQIKNYCLSLLKHEKVFEFLFLLFFWGVHVVGLFILFI